MFSSGKSFSLFPFRVIYKPEARSSKLKAESPKLQGQNSQLTAENLQCAFSVSKRHFKKATDRNRIKRLMREAWRLQKNDWQHSLQQNDQQAVVFLLYVGNELPDYKVVFEKVNAVLKKLQRISNEKPKGNT